MKVIAMAMCSVMMFSIIDTVEGDLASFFSAIPIEIGNVFSNAWDKISETIRRPVRIKRLGRGGKRRTTELLTTETTTEIKVTRAFFLSSRNPNFMNRAIPVIPKPNWQSLLNRMGFPEEITMPKEEIEVADCGSDECNSYDGGSHKRKIASDGYDNGIYRILFFV